MGFSQARRYESLLVCRARPLLASHAGNGAPSAHAMPALQNRRCHLRCSPSEQVELEVTASLVLASHVASFPRPSVRACRPRALNARAHCARPLRTPTHDVRDTGVILTPCRHRLSRAPFVRWATHLPVCAMRADGYLQLVFQKRQTWGARRSSEHTFLWPGVHECVEEASQGQPSAELMAVPSPRGARPGRVRRQLVV